MSIVPFKSYLKALKNRLKKNQKNELNSQYTVKVSEDLFNVISALTNTSFGKGKKAPDVIREALEIYFFYDLYLGNIEEKISPTDDRFDRLESLIKDSFQMAFGQGKSGKAKDFTIIQILIYCFFCYCIT